MDRNGVNDVAEIESSAGQGAGLLELWDGVGQVMWYHLGVCSLSAASRQFGAESAATLARMVLWRPRQKRPEAARTGREYVFWTVAALDPRVVARRSGATGAGLGRNDAGEPLDGALHQRRVPRLRHSSGEDAWWGPSKRVPGNPIG